MFYFEVRKNKEKACEIAQQALNDSEGTIEQADEDTYRDSKGIIDLLTENLELWKEEDAEGDN